MHVIAKRNVNYVLPLGIQLLQDKGIEVSPRGLRTLELPFPVATVYSSPLERVLFSGERDANPFFHFMEALWMLAGRNDVSWIQEFNSQIAQYSDDGLVFNGAYGFRFRKHWEKDQLVEVVDLLSKEPTTRRAVLTLWDPRSDLGVVKKDHPCNTQIFLLIRDGKLNITVCCRSNDLIFGLAGANCVQFSILQEYVAGLLGVGVGVYTQISNSFHAYIDRPDWDKVKGLLVPQHDLYSADVVRPYPLMSSPKSFNADLDRFMEYAEFTDLLSVAKNSFFNNVAVPMLDTWKAHKMYKKGLKLVSLIQASDWETACREWLERREK